MASNNGWLFVGAKQPDFGKQVLLWSGLAMIEALFQLFRDEKAEEERRKQFKLAMQQAFSQALGAVAGSLATGLNVILLYVTHFLQAVGIRVPVDKVTPEGVIFVAQWVLLLLVVYGVIYLVFLLITFFLRWLWWLLKVGVGLACLGLILNDHSVSTETKVLRVVCLWCVCILSGINLWRDWALAVRAVYLEKQVKILQIQASEMERWRKRTFILCRCLTGFFVCSVVSILLLLLSFGLKR